SSVAYGDTFPSRGRLGYGGNCSHQPCRERSCKERSDGIAERPVPHHAPCTEMRSVQTVITSSVAYGDT
ncbi:MAG: hypothetical protein IJX47_04025, partial [Clostridia bacterium]|nr:hypothetical protein [Clostridia bacterium]